MRLKHYAYSTERTYTGWIKRFIFFHDKKHPGEMGEPEIEAFLTWLAVDRNVEKSAQKRDTPASHGSILIGQGH